MKRILIIGATSAIAKATARLWAAQGATLCLVARKPDMLAQLAADMRVRGSPEVHTLELDANQYDRHAPVIDEAIRVLGGLDLALIAHGTLSDQQACQQDVGLAMQELGTNALSVISLCGHIANRLEAQRSGQIAVIGSVAGDRGRQSNYVYGTAKGAVAIFLQGLRQRLHKAGVGVLTIKPGFVDTPMTQAFRKGALWASPEKVARCIVGAVDRRANTLYAPGFWGLIMAVIRSIPEAVFKRLSL